MKKFINKKLLPIVAFNDASKTGSIKGGLPPENASRVTKKIEPRILIGLPINKSKTTSYF